jgi:hypothetical protein
MGLDVRKPIGLLLLLVGLQLAAHGMLAPEGAFQRSLGFNVNLYWGLAMAAFGLLFLGSAYSSRGGQ